MGGVHLYFYYGEWSAQQSKNISQKSPYTNQKNGALSL